MCQSHTVVHVRHWDTPSIKSVRATKPIHLNFLSERTKVGELIFACIHTCITFFIDHMLSSPSFVEEY